MIDALNSLSFVALLVLPPLLVVLADRARREPGGPTAPGGYMVARHLPWRWEWDAPEFDRAWPNATR